MVQAVIRIALSGCGAVARLYYAPALKLLADESVVVGVFDPEPAAAARAAGQLGAKVAGSFEDLLALEFDVLLVLSPPRFHCDQACRALERGVAVLCEKPMALTASDAARMAVAAGSSGMPLGINMVRRMLPQASIIKALIECRALGPLDTVDVFEGGPFDWPVSSPGWFAPGGGGGILEDIGVHVLDLLQWWLGDPDEIAYSDDAMGGVPANCRIELSFGITRATVRLSRDWHRPNGYRFNGQRGWLHWPIHQRDDLDGELCGEQVRIAPQADASYPDALARQIRALAAGAPAVAAADCIAGIGLVERCREVRRDMPMDWL
jgi:predicted dehydrogenase